MEDKGYNLRGKIAKSKSDKRKVPTKRVYKTQRKEKVVVDLTLNKTPKKSKRAQGAPIDPITAISTCCARTVTLRNIMDLAQTCSDDLLPLLLLSEVVEYASCGISIDGIFEALDNLMPNCASWGDFHELIPEGHIVDILLGTVLAELMDICVDVQDGVQYLTTEAYTVVSRINTAGFYVSELHKLFATMVARRADACTAVGTGYMAGRVVLELGQPLLKSKKASVVDLLPLIRAFRNTPLVSMVGADAGDIAAYPEFLSRWESWMSTHPGIRAYLDPHHFAIQVAGAPAIAGLGVILASLPAGVATQAPHMDPAGAAWVGLYTTANIHHAQSISVALRTHFGDGAGGGGGAGAAHRIMSFSTNAGGFTNW